VPDQTPPPNIQESNLETDPFILAQALKESQALALVNQSFHAAETFRTNNHDQRWREHDELYAAWLPERKWPGTQTKRSNVGVPVTFDQVESALPAIMAALFNNGSDWFQVAAEAGSDPKVAREIQQSMEYDFEHPKDYLGCTIRNEITLAVKQLLLHGNGGVYLDWDPILDRPFCEWVDLRDMYFDPGAPTPSVDENRFVIRRRRMTAKQILDLKENEAFKIPSQEELWDMVSNSTAAAADNTMAASEATRKINYTPGPSDWLPNSVDNKVEVLQYHSASREIWVINRQWVMLNRPNPLRFIKFCFAPCYTFMGRFYAMSIADVQGPNQRVIEGFINAHRDEIALRIHPPRATQRGAMTTPNESKFGPGVEFRVDDPTKDIAYPIPQAGLTNIYPDIQYFHTLADSRTGITGLGSGVPRPSNANRTAGGMQMQLQGSSNRLSSIVQNIEDYMITPLLYKMYKLKQFHLKPEQSVNARDENGGYYQIPAERFQNKVSFKMLASSRMMSKDKLLGMVPIFAQYMMQGPLVESLHSIGMTLDFGEFWNMVQDATGIKGRYQMIRQMTPQEQQMAQQNSPQAVEAQKIQAENQTKLQVAQMQSQTELQKTQMQNQPDPAAMAVEQQKLEAEKQKMAMDAEQKKMEMMFKVMMQKIQLDGKRQEMQMNAEAKQFETAHKMHAAQQEAQINQQRMQQQSEMDRMTHAQEGEMAQATHKVQLKNMIEEAKTKRQAMKLSGAGRPATKAGQPRQKKAEK
jgi:hypothetical protein